MTFTAKVYAVKRTGGARKAPKEIVLFGDKTKKAESASHIIKFPGGSIELSRHSDGRRYWAHIEVNHDQVSAELYRESRRGEIVASRVDYDDGEILEIEDVENVRHIAVLIDTSTGKDE